MPLIKYELGNKDL